MQITRLAIRNFRSIHSLEIGGIENALILVGKNNTGKTGILKAIRAALGNYPIAKEDFNEKNQNIEIWITLEITEQDLAQFHLSGIVSQYKRFDAWKRDFRAKLPSFDGHEISFTCVFNHNQAVRYQDNARKHNRFIPELLPRLYFIDTGRQLTAFQEDLLLFQDEEQGIL